MIYKTVKFPHWNHNKSMVNCVVDFVNFGELPFSASPNDSAEHGREIYARCIAGDFGPIADYVSQPDEGPQEPTFEPVNEQIPVTNVGEVL
jgi:hypothetical protein